MRRWILIAACLPLGACGGCSDSGAPPPDAAVPAAGAIQPWTLGAARTEEALVLPPPCVEREPALVAVLGRPTRIAAEPHSLGKLWVAEGPGADAWRADASGVVALLHGRTRPVSAPWPERGTPVLATSGDAWMLVYDEGDTLRLRWRDQTHEIERGALGVDLSCDDERCALLFEIGGRPAMRWGPRDAPPSSWRRLDLSELGDSPLAVSVESGIVSVALKDALRARFVRIHGDEEPEQVVALSTMPALLAVSTAPPAVMTEPAYQLVEGCADEGGVSVALEGRGTTRLRAPEPATSGGLAPMKRGLLATWLAPPRCRSRRRMLHAAIVGYDGRPVGPVTTVGHADSVQVATDGANVDLWLRHDSDNTLTWVRARCR